MPAALGLAGGGILRCEQVLRLLPGKRAVMKAQWQGRPALVKLLLNTASGRRNIRRELAGHRILKAAKIPTPDLLLTARCDDGSHVLVFEFLQQAQCLGELWRNRADRRLEIVASGLGLIARLHRKGCHHTDPHLDNFLLAGEQLYVVDAASVARRDIHVAGYGRWQRKNLALFLAQFPPAWRKPALNTLGQNYAAAADDHKLGKAVDWAWRSRKSGYLKKCFRESTEFSTRINWHQASAWKRACYSADLGSFLQNPDAWIEKGELLKDGGSATVVRIQMNGRAVVIKRNNIRNVFHFLRATRSRINWRNAHLLKISGIATPEPVAFMEKRWGPFRLRGYYVCAFNRFPLAAKLYASRQPTKQELAWFKGLFTAMRMARLCHGDFKASNFFVTDDGVALIDLDSIREFFSDAKLRACLQKDENRFLKNWKDKPERLKLFSAIFSKA